MSLQRLDIAGFRNLTSVRLELLPEGSNYFFGQNGSGKTSLIEAVYFALCGRSFRSSNVLHLIQHTTDHFTVACRIRRNTEAPYFMLGVERQRLGQVKNCLNNQPIHSFADIARQFPVLLVHAGSHHLLDAGPVFRRKFLDWGAFNQRPDYLVLWKRYARALRQRNALLRQRKGGAELDTWTQEMITSGVALDAARQEFVMPLTPLLTAALADLLVLPNLKMQYQPGWQSGLSYSEACELSFARDRQMGCTHAGPHRADFKLSINGMPAKEVLSRGQQKLFVYAMIVAQGALIKQCQNSPPIYLLDDLPAELDGDSRARLMGLLQAQKAQVLFTGILPDFPEFGSTRMFHVEHGAIRVCGSNELRGIST